MALPEKKHKDGNNKGNKLNNINSNMVWKPSYRAIVAEASLPTLPDSATFNGTFRRQELEPGEEGAIRNGDRPKGNEPIGGQEHGGDEEGKVPLPVMETLTL